MAYYAPFYRPTYYDPVQQNPIGQFNQQFQQPMTQPMQNAQMPMQGQPTNDFLWVLNENEATSYPVAPNNTVTLWDKNLPTIYIKSKEKFRLMPFVTIYTAIMELINDGYIEQTEFEKAGGSDVAVHKFEPPKKECRRLHCKGDCQCNGQCVG